VLSRLRIREIFCVVAGHTVLPAAPHNALPFEGEGAEGGLAAFAPVELHPVIALGPDAKRERSARQFVESLAQELGASPAHVDADALAAGLLTGAMPLYAAIASLLSKRSRWVPQAAASRGASAGPAPGKLSQIP